MLREIKFAGYKAFRDLTSIEIKPITLVVGKNSSGKSSILKLFPMLENMLSGRITYPLLMNNNGVSLGAEYEDLFYHRSTSGFKLWLHFTEQVRIGASYYTNGGAIGISEYHAIKGEQEAQRRLQDDKSMIHGILDDDLFQLTGIDAASLKIKVNYIGPFRIPALHNIVYQGQDNTIGIGYDGSGAYKMLLNSYRANRILYKNVSEWMGNNLEGQSIEFNNLSNSSGSFNLQVAHGDFSTNVTTVGQGVSQVIPVVTQSYVAEEDSINVIEQPALHLHPASHASISYRLGQSAKERNCRYVIETHSENLLLGFRHMIVNPEVDFHPDDFVMYFIDNIDGVATAEKITINGKGNLSSWPTGVFSESFELLRQINEMRAR